jgi:hypothetical protein
VIFLEAGSRIGLLGFTIIDGLIIANLKRR